MNINGLLQLQMLVEVLKNLAAYWKIFLRLLYCVFTGIVQNNWWLLPFCLYGIEEFKKWYFYTFLKRQWIDHFSIFFTFFIWLWQHFLVSLNKPIVINVNFISVFLDGSLNFPDRLTRVPFKIIICRILRDPGHATICGLNRVQSLISVGYFVYCTSVLGLIFVLFSNII